MSKKIKYVPPAAEMILLAPCENLAFQDWAFGKSWRQEWGKFKDDNGASAIVFGGTTFEEEDLGGAGFFTKTGTS